jgi:pyruvate carboxylase
MRDGHQSCSPPACARSTSSRFAGAYADGLPELLSLECWGGATFDVAYALPAPKPVGAAGEIARKMPNILTQMLLRGANGVGYTNYPDNVVRQFVARPRSGGIDLFRVFDCLNWVENMRVSMDAVREAEQALRRHDLLHRRHLDPDRPKYDLPTMSIWPRSWKPPAPTSSASRTWPGC